MTTINDKQLEYDLKRATVKNMLLDNVLKQQEIDMKKIEQHNLTIIPVHEMIRTVATIFGAGAALIFTLVRIF